MPTIIGGIFGAIAAALMPNLYLKPVLLISILTMSLLILVKPEVIAPAPGTPILSPTKHLVAWRGLFATGVYGGFMQAGVGFILLAALAGGLRYDLIRAHALKMACSIAFTTVAIFIFLDKVWWVPGLILALGSIIGRLLTMKIAVKASQSSIKSFLFLMTLCAVIAGFIF